MTDLVIRAPRGQEAVACRMLLPEAADSTARESLLALASEPPYIVGAAAMVRLPGEFDGLAIQVVPRCRRRGIATRLLARIEEDARACGIGRLRGAIQTLHLTDGAAFAAARGFRRVDRMTRWQCEAGPFLECQWNARRRLQQRRTVPPGAHVEPLGEANRDGVARLWAQYLADRPRRLDSLEYDLSAPRYAPSRVVMDGETVAGFELIRTEGRVVLVDAKVIAPPYRRGWASVLLNAAAADLALGLGAEIVEFAWAEDVTDTARMAARFPGRVTSVLDRYEKP